VQFKDVIINPKVTKLLLKGVKSDRVSHAQMFLGPEGSGKLPLAIAFSQYLLCDNPSPKDSCGECPNCQKVSSLTHPDLHFVYPIVISKTDHVASSDDVRADWNAIVQKQKYFNVDTWLDKLDSPGKNPIIGVEESRNINKKLSLKAYGDKYKIMIIWLPERMNGQAANKMLKLLEEPPEKTIFLLVCDSAEYILPTIISRTQIINIPSMDIEEITKYISKQYGVEKAIAESLAALSQGNIVEAINAVEGDKNHHIYFELFVKLMRSAYAANPNELISVAEEVAALDKEKQKNFVRYGLHIFRESIIMNYMKGQLLNLRNEEKAFLQKFAKFINNQNISELIEEFDLAHFHLERNANSKILFTDLVIKLTKLVRKGV
jgi:DNA polymerase-3 subunit delta'